jgi:hypothetical protein
MAAWKLVTRPRSKGSLGVIKLRVQNDVFSYEASTQILL